MWDALEAETVKGQSGMRSGNTTTDEILIDAVEQLWTGQIDVYDHKGALGEVILEQGRVAWARCRAQDENLADLLWRLGRISRGQLTQVRQIFNDNGGGRRLGSILEEQGFMSRPVLRRCLLLHTRNAIERLISTPDSRARLKIKGNGLTSLTDEQILFGPLEVLPAPLLLEIELPEELDEGDAWVQSWFSLNRNNVVLRELAEVVGYQASAVFSFDGDVVAAHSRFEDIDVAATCVYMAAMMEAGSRAAAAARVPSQQNVTLQCEEGWVSACWLDNNRYYQALVLADRTGDPSEIGAAMGRAAPRLQAWLMPAAG
jgi:predicted regulator of Ras-like GTPase activity (Roadblock/LC7/MglB family)